MSMLLKSKSSVWQGSVGGSHYQPFASAQKRKAAAGKAGRPISLLANHFGMTLSRKDPVHHYDVKMFVKPKAGGQANPTVAQGGARKKPQPKATGEKPLRKSESELALKAIIQLDKEHPQVSKWEA